MCAPEIIPGVLLSSRPIRLERPALHDLTATILDLFGIGKPEDMTGRTAV